MTYRENLARLIVAQRVTCNDINLLKGEDMLSRAIAIAIGIAASIPAVATAGMTAIYTGSPFTHGQTRWGSITFSVTFRDGFTPASDQWSSSADIVSYSAGLTSGPSFFPQDHIFAQFLFDDAGHISRWWLGVSHYPTPYAVYSSADFTTYKNGLDGPAAWDFAILPGQGNAAWNDVSTGKWSQSELVTPTAVPEPSTLVMLGVGLFAVSGLSRKRKSTNNMAIK